MRIIKNACLTVLILFILLCNITLASQNAEYSYRILSDKSYRTIKRSIDVRLDRRITQQQLKILAQKIKALDSNHYDRTFICYFLPHQKLNAGAWASTHYNPQLKVQILGATVADVKGFRTFSILNGWQVPEPAKAPSAEPVIWSEIRDIPVNLRHGGEIIGEWIFDQGELSHKITVFKKNGTTMMNKYYRGGKQGTEKLKSTKVRQGLRLEQLESNSFGEYFVVSKNNQLEFYDSQGLFLTLPPEVNNKRSK